MKRDPLFDGNGEFDFEEFQEDVSFAADIVGVSQRDKANRLAQETNRLLRAQANERKRVAALPQCPHCAGPIPRTGVSVCTHCRNNLDWVLGEVTEPSKATSKRRKIFNDVSTDVSRWHKKDFTTRRSMSYQLERTTIPKLRRVLKEAKEAKECDHDFINFAAKEITRLTKACKDQWAKLRQYEADQKQKAADKREKMSSRRENDIRIYGEETVAAWEAGPTRRGTVLEWSLMLIGTTLLGFWLVVFIPFQLITWAGGHTPEWYQEVPIYLRVLLWVLFVPGYFVISALDAVSESLNTQFDASIPGEEERRRQSIAKIKEEEKQLEEEKKQREIESSKRWLRCSKCSHRFFIIEANQQDKEVVDCPHCGAKLRIHKKAPQP